MIIFAALTLAVGGISSLAWAEDAGRCPPMLQAPVGAPSSAEDSTDSEEDAGGFRRLAAPFAPDVALRVWYQTRTQIRGRARAYVITKSARPDQILSVDREPFGWQVSLSWNLVDIAQTILPGEATPLRLYASDCAAFGRPMDPLFEYGAGGYLEEAEPGEDARDARRDL